MNKINSNCKYGKQIDFIFLPVTYIVLVSCIKMHQKLIIDFENIVKESSKNNA